MTDISTVLTSIFCSGLIIFAERAFPFLLFSKQNKLGFINFIEKYIPPMVMATLLFYCLKDISFVKTAAEISRIDFAGFVPYIAGIAVTVSLHLWKKNSLLSIFGGTAVYMILIRVL